MIELVVIYFVGRQNSDIASAKGRSGVGWFVATAAVWLGLQGAVSLVGILLLASWYGLEPEFPELPEFLVVYVPSLIAAGAGVMALNRKLLAVPDAI
jgi:hypothetical protein